MNRSSTWLSLGISVALIGAALLFLNYWGYRPLFGLHGVWPMSQGGYGGMMAYSGWGMGIGMLLFWGILVVALVSLIAGIFGRNGRAQAPGDRGDDALEILKKRYARGEIDKTEFETKRRDLNTGFSERP